MRKTFLSYVAVVMLISVLCSCKAKESTTITSNPDVSTEKIAKKITASSGFSEGLAFVNFDNNTQKLYCINEKGETVFELEKNINASNVEKFSNGYTLVDGAVCDKKGKLTYPNDVGVTQFSLLAIEGGYIFAELKNATFDSTNTKIGIMDTTFNWVVKPTEEIAEKIGVIFNASISVDTSYFKDTFCLVSYNTLYLNLKTGAFSEVAPCELPTDKWIIYNDNTYRDYSKNIMLDLGTKYNNITYLSEFINGKAVVVFFNGSSQEYFYTITDKNGNFQFEPISFCKDRSMTIHGYDGMYILFQFSKKPFNETDINDKAESAACYDINGKLMGKFAGDMLFDNESADVYWLEDGVVNVSCISNGNAVYYFYSPEAKKMF